MNIARFDNSKLSENYNILSYSYASLVGSLPIQPTWCVVETEKSTHPHAHFESEMFLILSGSGNMIIDNEIQEVGPGDLIMIPAGATHQLKNSSSESLNFLSLFWPPSQVSFKPHADVLLMAAPPTPNGDLHLGHLSGPYLAMDIYKRLLNAAGKMGFSLTGSDDHQSYVDLKGANENRLPEAVAADYGLKIRQSLAAASMDINLFSRPSCDEDFKKSARKYFSKLVRSGFIAFKPVKVLQRPSDSQRLYGGFVVGGCPHCQNQTSGGMCEGCFRHHEDWELLNPRCKRSGEKLDSIVVEQPVFTLSNWQKAIIKHLQSITMPDAIRHLLSESLRQTLQDFSAAHQSSWGISTAPGSDLYIHEWVEMAFMYAHLDECGFTPGHVKRVQFFGVDNSFYYGILHVALFQALEKEHLIPKEFVVNQFLLLDGEKFSTSRSHAIWGRDFIGYVGADVLRAYLAKLYSSRSSNSFTLSELSEFIRERLIECWAASFNQARQRMLLNYGERPVITEERERLTRRILLSFPASPDYFAKNLENLILSLNGGATPGQDMARFLACLQLAGVLMPSHFSAVKSRRSFQGMTWQQLLSGIKPLDFSQALAGLDSYLASRSQP